MQALSLHEGVLEAILEEVQEAGMHE